MRLFGIMTCPSALSAMIALACFLSCAGQTKSPSSVRDGVYSTAQAGRGESAYRESCAKCHGAKLEGQGQAPGLTGDDFNSSWNGMTVDDLFERVQETMPADKPGQLNRNQNADILAYIFQVNKYPAGAKDLLTDAEALKAIRIEAAQK